MAKTLALVAPSSPEYSAANAFGIGEVVLLPAFLAQHLGELFGLLDRRGADQHRLAALLAVFDQRDDRAVFFCGRAIDLVIVVDADQRHVGRHFEHFEIVDVEELVGFRQRRAGHAAELVVHAEVVLEGDRSERLVLRLDRHVLLGLERLMQAFGIAAARHHAAGELVDDDDLVIADDVVLVALEQLVRAQRLIDVVDDRNVLDVVERGNLQEVRVAQHGLHLFHAGFGHGDGALLLVDLVVGLVEPWNVAVDRIVELGTVVERAGNNKRRARFVDQDGVDFVHDRIDVAALDHVLDPVLHIVAQVIEAELVIGAVGDVAGIRLLALRIVQAMHDHADRQAEEAVDLAHPLGVALGEVIVDGDDVHAAPGERIEINRQRCDQRLAFAGLHLGDLAFVQDHAADQLHVEMALAERALGGFAHRRERVDQDVVKRSAVGELLLQFAGACLQRVVGQRFELLLQCIDGANARLIAADAPVIGRAEQFTGDSADHFYSLILAGRPNHDDPPAFLAALRNSANLGENTRRMRGWRLRGDIGVGLNLVN